MKGVKVSIILATYNRAHLIEEALNSILSQTWQRWECLIIDDGSTDNTIGVLKNYSTLDSRFKFYSRSNKYIKGLPGCRNYGLDLASGNYIIFFDDDDLVHPQNLEICLKFFEKSKIDFVNYQKQIFYNRKPTLGQINSRALSPIEFGAKDISAFITGKKAMASCTVMWNKVCFDKIRFNEDLQYAEEWECYTRILLEGFEGISIEEVLYFNRKHPDSNTGEFNNGDKIRKSAMSKAALLVIENLSEQNKLIVELQRFFIRLGFQIQDYSIIRKILENESSSVNIKYKLGYTFYPLLKPLFKIKGKLLKS